MTRCLAIALALALSACGHNLADSGRRVIVAGDQFGEKLGQSLASYDYDHELALAKAGKAAELEAYRAQYDKLRHLLDVYQSSLNTGEALIALYEAGQPRAAEIAIWLARVYDLGKQILSLVETLGLKMENAPP